MTEPKDHDIAEFIIQTQRYVQAIAEVLPIDPEIDEYVDSVLAEATKNSLKNKRPITRKQNACQNP